MLLRKKTLIQDVKPIRRRAPVLNPNKRTVFKTKRKSLSKKKKIYFYLLVAFAVIIISAAYYVLFWSSLFKITEPIVVGNSRVSTDFIQEQINSHISGNLFGIFPRRAILSINRQAITASILNASSAIETVDVRKELPNILKVVISEREPLAIWSAAGQFYFVDDRGIAYDEIMRSESRDASVPVIVDEHNKATVEGDRVMTKETLDFVISTYSAFSTVEDLSINFFIAPSRLAPDLTLVTNEGWKVLFDTSRDGESQIKILREVLEREVEDTNTLEYIDLRIPGRVFVQ